MESLCRKKPWLRGHGDRPVLRAPDATPQPLSPTPHTGRPPNPQSHPTHRLAPKSPALSHTQADSQTHLTHRLALETSIRWTLPSHLQHFWPLWGESQPGCLHPYEPQASTALPANHFLWT